MEMLPMARVGSLFCKHKEPMFLLHPVPPYMLDVMLRGFRLLNVPLTRLWMPDHDEAMHFEDLIVVRGLTQHGKYMSPIAVAAITRLAEGVMPAEHRKLFVRRRADRRLLQNEEEACVRLEACGYTIIDPGELPLEQQIALFKGAERVVGAIGAAMTNIVFCRPGTQVVMISGADFPDTFFWFLAQHRKLGYSEIRCEKTLVSDFAPYADFRISEADIEWLESPGDLPGLHPAEINAYIHDVGDVEGGVDQWVGTPGSGHWIEGFNTQLGESKKVRYRAVLGRNWFSSWVREGEFCGTRGYSLPLLGLVIDATGDPFNELRCQATFVDGSRKENVPAGEACFADTMAPLEAFQVSVRPKVRMDVFGEASTAG